MSESSAAAAEAVAPAHFGEKTDDLPDRHQDADRERAENDAVERRIGEEGRPDLTVQENRKERGEHQKHDHPEQEDPGRRNFDEMFVVARHEAS